MNIPPTPSLLETMHVPVFKGEGRLVYEDRPVPPLNHPGDVRLRVEACGICGTDLNILAMPPRHRATPDIIIGHEGVGIVEEVGFAVTGLLPGDRVVVAPRLTCGSCAYCRRGLDNQCLDYQTIGTTIDGAFAPYLCARQSALFKIDQGVPLDDAVLFEPLSCVLGSMVRAPIQAGDNVMIIGAGPMGLLFALVYRAMGAGRIIVSDIVPERLAFARVLGVDEVYNPDEVDLPAAVQASTGLGADLVVDAVGNQLATAVKLARRAGHVILFGLRPHDTAALSQHAITRHDLTIHGTFVGNKPFAQTIKLLESGRLQPSALVTHRLPLSALAEGIDLMRGGQSMKVVITPQTTVLTANHHT